MLGERSDRRGLWEADRLYRDQVGRDTFYGVLASLRGHWTLATPPSGRQPRRG